MTGKKLRLYSFLVVAGIILLILWNSLSQEGVQDLEGDFSRVAFFKNENNTGPVERIYAVTVADTLWEEMKQYGDFMPHTKYGTTRVYFFPKESPVPGQVKPGQENFDSHYQEYVWALYEKNAMGQVSFIREPFQ